MRACLTFLFLAFLTLGTVGCGGQRPTPTEDTAAQPPPTMEKPAPGNLPPE
jgi:hypothetical protein